MKKFNEQVTYAVSADRVREAQTDEGFVDFLASRFASELNAQVLAKESRMDGETAVLTATVHVPIEGLPDIASRFLGKGIDVTVTERWNPASGDTHTGDFSVTTDPKKATLTSDFTLADAEGGSVRSYDGSFTVHVPLVGGAIESQAMKYIASVLRVEKRAVEAYLEQKDS